ncbi:SGNH/GDSL hydrolase family protein [Nocardioides sp. Soil774]|uniref:SGNH/GDSL hydrolase family protein n=1 Tax=Nocardioides sp. Soil774 TaxID=1736408 RepID=UPI0009E75855|nr:GDSL-type esterase/lipase family protein [Nocardioides sp. Soil774]
MRIVLLGDSHLARIRRDLAMIGPHERNAAEGGACALDLVAQARTAAVEQHDVVVVSVGTNDAAPRRQVPTAAYVRALLDCTRSVPARGWIYHAPPGVDESRLGGACGRTNATIDAYRDAAVTACDEAGVRVVRTERVIEPLGARAFVSDGLHLGGAAYGLVLPAIAEAVRAVA